MTDTAHAAPELGSDARDALGRLISSLADNKAALGRRYGEWAVSAPTLESAVAAAAMAQDELGHARATYPLLKQLGVADGQDEDHLEIGACMPVLATELPGWPWFVAVNLVVDGMLAAFVSASEESAFTQLAQRARKILQEERSHEAHGRAWSRRLARDELQRGEFAAAVSECWREAARWPGPADDRGYGLLAAGGYLAGTPDALRSEVRQRIAATLADTGLKVELPDPHDWSGWSPHERR